MPDVTVRMSTVLKARLDALSVETGESINSLVVLAIDRLISATKPSFVSRPVEQAEDFDEPCSE